MKSLGLTGTMASGKSHVAQFIELLGYPVFKSDLEGKLLLESPEIIEKIIDYFGNEITKDNKIDRKKLAHIVFNNSIKLNYLNSIIHPAVVESYKKWKNNQNSKIVFHESAIIFEHKLEYLFDAIICVYSPRDICIKRAMKRDNLSLNDIENRLLNQLSAEDKCKKADFVIVNDDKTAIMPQILSIINYY